MNKERILAVADKIEKLPHKRDDNILSHENVESFSMISYTTNCGSPQCIAGWVNHLYGKFPPEEMAKCDFDHLHKAAELLDINEQQAWELFHPNGTWRFITQTQAAQTLRDLAETGSVIWEHHNVDGQ